MAGEIKKLSFPDGVIVDPPTEVIITASGSVITPWESYDPVTSGMTAPSANFVWRRVGDSIEINGTLVVGTVTGEINIDIPTLLTIDYSKITRGSSASIGYCMAVDLSAAGAKHDGNVQTAANSTSTFRFQGDDGLGIWSNSVAPQGAWATNDEIHVKVRVPIVEWENSGTVTDFVQDNLSEWTQYTPTFTNWTTVQQSFFYRRIGDSIQIHGAAELDAPSTGGMYFSLPPGLNLDVTKFADFDGNGGGGSGASRVGRCDCFIGSTLYPGQIAMIGTSTDTMVLQQDTGANSTSIWNATVPDTWAADSEIRRMWVECPIAEWAGSQNSLIGLTEATNASPGLVGPLGDINSIINSGSYTPTPAVVSNCSGLITYQTLYTRVGDVVTVSFRVQLSITATDTLTEMTLTLPIATTFATPSRQLWGTCTFSRGASIEDESGYIIGLDGGGLARIITEGTSFSGGANVYGTFQYLIQ